MPTSLSSLQLKLSAQIKTLDTAFTRHLALGSSVRRVDRNAAREGYISALWQAWGRFMRSILLESIRGAIKSDGTITTSPHSGRPEGEIVFIARQLALGHAVTTIKSAPFYSEPTWGDISKAIQIVAGTNISNGTELLTALSLPTSVSDLQACRNACAHLRVEQLAQLKLARVRYSNTQLLHPSDAATWVDPATGGYLWGLWVDDMLTASQFACK